MAPDCLAGVGAERVTTGIVAFEGLRTAELPAFRDVLALVKQGAPNQTPDNRPPVGGLL